MIIYIHDYLSHISNIHRIIFIQLKTIRLSAIFILVISPSTPVTAGLEGRGCCRSVRQCGGRGHCGGTHSAEGAVSVDHEWYTTAALPAYQLWVTTCYNQSVISTTSIPLA